MNYQEFSRKTRLPFGFLLGIVFLLFATPARELLPFGIAIAFVGLCIRAWAAGHIDKNSRLATTGPYAHVRNPLYLGSFLLALGFALVWEWWFVLLVIAFFVLIYAPTIQQERAAMASRFPAEYPEYEANVPLFFPRLSPWQPATASGTEEVAVGFDVRRYMRHAEWKAALGFAAGTAWLVIRMQLGV